MTPTLTFSTSPRTDWVKINDIKQWFYCPRVVFYQNVMSGVGQPTFKMGQGKKAQEWYEALELRRQLSKYGLDGGKRLTGQFLKSDTLGLLGKPDLLVVHGAEAVVVDYKLTGDDLRENQHMQLVAYALLAEDCLELRIRRGFIYRISDSELFEVEIGDSQRQKVLDAIDQIRTTIKEQEIPEPTPHRARCEDCEYQNFCADVW